MPYDVSNRLFPVLATFGAAARIGLEIERLDDGRIVVMTPNSPNTWSRVVQITPPEQLQRLDLPMAAYIENVERFGQGTTHLLRESVP